MRKAIFSFFVIMFLILVMYGNTNIQSYNQEKENFEIRNTHKTEEIYNCSTLTFFEPFKFKDDLYLSIYEPWEGKFSILNASDNWQPINFVNPTSSDYFRKIFVKDESITIVTRDDSNFIFYSSQDWMNWELVRVNLNITEIFTNIFDIEYFELMNNTQVLFLTATLKTNQINNEYLFSIQEDNGNWTLRTIVSADFYSGDLSAIRITDDHFILSYDIGEYIFNKQVNILNLESGKKEITKINTQFVPDLLWLENGKLVLSSEKILPFFPKDVIEISYFSSSGEDNKYSTYILCENLNTNYENPILLKHNSSIFLFFERLTVDLVSNTYSETISLHIISELDDKLREEKPQININLEIRRNEANLNITLNFNEIKDFVEEEFLMIYYEISVNNVSKNMFGLFRNEVIQNFTNTIYLENLIIPENTSEILIKILILTQNHYWFHLELIDIELKKGLFDWILILLITVFFAGIVLARIKLRRDIIKKKRWLKAWKEGNIGKLNLDESITKLKHYAFLFLFLLILVWVLSILFKTQLNGVPIYLINFTSWVFGIVSLITGGIFALSRFRYQELLNQKIYGTLFNEKTGITKEKIIITERKKWSEDLAVRFTNIGSSFVFIKQIVLIAFKFRFPILPTERRIGFNLLYATPLERNKEEQKKMAKYVNVNLKHGEYRTIAARTIKNHICELERKLEESKRKNMIKNKPLFIKIIFIVLYLVYSTIQPLLFVYNLFKYGIKSQTSVALAALRCDVETLQEYMKKPEREFYYSNILCLVYLRELDSFDKQQNEIEEDEIEGVE